MKRDYSLLIWGLLLIVVGIIFSGNALNIWSIDIFFPGWWTLFLIIPGLVSIIKHGLNWGSGILVILGLMLLLDELDIITGEVMWKLVFPLIYTAVKKIGNKIVTCLFCVLKEMLKFVIYCNIID